MDPNEAYRLWKLALEELARNPDAKSLRIDVRDRGSDLAEWLNQGGFEPSWDARERQTFWDWWDGTHDFTEVWESPEHFAVLQEGEERATLDCGCVLARDEERVTLDDCGAHRVSLGDSSLTNAASALLAELEDAGIAEAGESWNDLQRAAEALRKVLDSTSYASKVNEYRCPDCGCTDVEGTSWLHLNTDRPVNSEPPTSDFWCPKCEEHPPSLCLVDRATGECREHRDVAGRACKPVRR